SGAFLNWQSFNILSGQTTSFIQPSANSIVVNRINGTEPSKIWGALTANGTVILANANGFYFGPNSLIRVGGSFVATTAPLLPDFGAGASWQFTGMRPLALSHIRASRELWYIVRSRGRYWALRRQASPCQRTAGWERTERDGRTA